MQENLIWVFVFSKDTNQPAKLQRLARILKFRETQVESLCQAHYKDAYQIARMPRLVCGFVVRIEQSQVFSDRGPRNIRTSYIWASKQENLFSECCEQQRRRPACTSAQSDQRLCYLLFRKYYIFPCYKQNFIFLASLSSWGDWFESHFVRKPEDMFSRIAAHIS